MAQFCPDFDVIFKKGLPGKMAQFFPDFHIKKKGFQGKMAQFSPDSHVI